MDRLVGEWEVSASTYPWDLHDEGVDTVLDNLQEMSNINSVYHIGLMHTERHPWPTDATFPHNPVRESYMTEDARAYWNPDPRNYGKMRPSRTNADFLKDVDWLDLMIAAARKRGLRTGFEISHSVIDREI